MRRSLGVLCVHLSQFSADFARDLTAALAPFGRLLDVHAVKRVVQARRARSSRPVLHDPAVQVLAVIECHVSGALAAALGLSATAASAGPPPPDAPPGAAGCHRLWGRVVVMRLEDSGEDAVTCRAGVDAVLCARDAGCRFTWWSCCTRRCSSCCKQQALPRASLHDPR